MISGPLRKVNGLVYAVKSKRLRLQSTGAAARSAPAAGRRGTMTVIRDQIVLVTGASRGLGKAFVAALLARGAQKVYATARDPQTIAVDEARVVPLRLDVTDVASVAALVAQVGDLTMLVNNAGILVGASLLTGDLDAVRREFETNFYGPLHVTRALAPLILGNGGGAILNVHSALSWIALGSSYSGTMAT